MRERLEHVLRKYTDVTIAVSGGVDSMTLAYAANKVHSSAAKMVHAVSPAVPPAATQRVEEHALRHDWNLQVINANEFDDDRYVENPSNRCFYCKSNLYGTIAGLGVSTIMSGTNLDDLSDWRPGLEAARNFDVVHPFVEAQMRKSDVRVLATEFKLAGIADLPASPCLSSRIETGIGIDPGTLKFVDTVEEYVRKKLVPNTVRCRIKQRSIVISLDDETLSRLSDGDVEELSKEVAQLRPTILNKPISIGAYTRGESFLR